LIRFFIIPHRLSIICNNIRDIFKLFLAHGLIGFDLGS
jgi:hypothetical protein